MTTAPPESAPTLVQTSLSAGNGRACAVIDELAQCWGGGYASGDDTLSSEMVAAPIPGIGAARDVAVGWDSACVVVKNLGPATSVSVGSSTSCAVLESATLWCWGTDQTRVPKIGDEKLPNLPRQVDLPEPVAEVSVSGGSSCALGTSGKIWCWGMSEIAIGAKSGYSGPQLISVPPSKAVSVGAPSEGFETACAVLVDGTVQCWGGHDTGQAGNGTKGSTAPLKPTPVVGMTAATAVDVALQTSCAVSNGSVWCWGKNSSGQLGNGTTADSPTPVTVPGIGGASAVGVGDGYTCAAGADFGVKCWGDGRDGALGNGSTAQSLTPVSVQLVKQ